LQVGVLLLSITFLLQIQLLKPGVNTWMIISLMGIWGLGNGLVLPSLLNIALTSVPVEYAGAAAGVYSTFQQTASALGVCIIGGIFFYFSGQSWQIAYTAGITAILVAVQHVQLIAVQG
jgi:MFS family permease